MTILVCASEVGSVRALQPVCHELLRRQQQIIIVERGFFSELNDAALTPHYSTLPEDTEAIIRFLQDRRISALLFSVNVHDTQPLRVARAAHSLGIPTLHVLDYWNGYRKRMELDGETLFIPYCYMTPDDYAAQQAAQQGIPARCIQVTGQPAFAEVMDAHQQASQQPVAIPIGNRRLILFVAEPVSHDQGRSLNDNPDYRGYTEYDALRVLYSAASQCAAPCHIAILPHPRQDIAELRDYWSTLDKQGLGGIIQNVRARDLLPQAAGVAGMASTLLYEAWLTGKPVLSIQPGLRNDALRMMQQKSGVFFIDDYQSANDNAIKWLDTLDGVPQAAPRAEMQLHMRAPAVIAEAVIQSSKREKF